MSWKDVGQAAFILVVTMVVVAGASAVSNIFKNPISIGNKPDDVKKGVECPADWSSFEATEKKLKVLDNVASNGSGESLKGYRVTIDRTGLTSDIACGYLLYRVSYGAKPIEQSFMSLFMRPTDSQLGGHILPDEKKGAIIKEEDGQTVVLIPLSAVTYDGLERSPIKEVNWAALLNVAEKMEFEVALSADVPNGKINSLEIAYKCVNKETGLATTDCNLDVSNTVPFGF